MTNQNAAESFREYLEEQMDLWNRRLLGIESEGAAGADPDRSAVDARLLAARSKLGEILASLGPDRAAVVEEERARAQTVLTELARLWDRRRQA